MKKIAIFCGSKAGNHTAYAEMTKRLAQVLVENNLTLVYGGAKVGLMGILANEALKHNGNVIGVIPQSLVDIEVAHTQLTELHIVNSMAERKNLITQLADAFILLPGAAGSLDEFFEVFTLAQLGYHLKPCAILNVNHYYDSLLQFLNHSVKEGFLRKEYYDTILVDTSPEKLVQSITQHFVSKHFA